MTMKEMDLNKFCELGILQEVNRVFFHPIGLALSVGVDKNSRIVNLSAVLETDDPDGIIFDDIDYDKATKFREWAKDRTPTREKNLNFKIQPSMKLNEDKDG